MQVPKFAYDISNKTKNLNKRQINIRNTISDYSFDAYNYKN